MAEETQVLRIEVAGREDIDKSIVSLGTLTEANKRLREERKNLDVSTQEGKARINQLNKAIDTNNKTIKENVSQLEKQRMNVGAYKDALDKLMPGIGSTIEGFKGMITAAKAFIATPIGLILAGLAAAFAILRAAFQKFEPVLDFFENAITQVSAVLDVFLDNIQNVGKILLNVVTFNFSEAANGIADLETEFKNAAREAQNLLDRTRELEDAQLRYSIQTAKTQNEIKALIIASKNANLTEAERQNLLDQALQKEEELTKRKRTLANEEAEILLGKLLLTKEFQLEQAQIVREQGEELDKFLTRLVDSGIFSPEQLQPVIDAYQKVADAESGSLALQEKIANQIATSREKQQKELEKEQERLLDQQQTAINNAAIKRDENFKAISNDALKLSQVQIQIGKDTAAKIVETEEQKAARLAEIRMIALEQEQAAAIQTQQLQQQGFATAQELFGRSKAGASALTLASTYFAAQKAFESQFLPIPTPDSPVRGTIAAALAVIQGLGRVAAINGVGFGAAAGGADFVTKGPTLLLVGDNPGGMEHVQVTPMSGRGKSWMKGNNVAMAGGGTLRAYSDGRMSTSTAGIDSQLSLVNAFKRTPRTVVSWREGRDIGDRVALKESITSV